LGISVTAARRIRSPTGELPDATPLPTLLRGLNDLYILEDQYRKRPQMFGRSGLVVQLLLDLVRGQERIMGNQEDALAELELLRESNVALQQRIDAREMAEDALIKELQDKVNQGASADAVLATIKESIRQRRLEVDAAAEDISSTSERDPVVEPEPEPEPPVEEQPQG
jgi:hypothetical protein